MQRLFNCFVFFIVHRANISISTGIAIPTRIATNTNTTTTYTSSHGAAETLRSRLPHRGGKLEIDFQPEKKCTKIITNHLE